MMRLQNIGFRKNSISVFAGTNGTNRMLYN